MNVKKRKVVLIFSGGMDSTTLLYDLVDYGYAVYCLSFDYNQLHIKEIYEAGGRILEGLRMPSGRWIRTKLDSALLLTQSAPVPDGATEAAMKINIVPNRNTIMLSIAWSYAISIGAGAVAIGVHAGSLYPDAQPSYLTALKDAFVMGNVKEASCQSFITPYVYLSKAQIVQLGTRLKVPYSLTWSCYKGLDIHCGTCGACVSRIEAFKEARIEDPTIYKLKGL